MDSRAIGVFDSGLGGLTVLKAIMELMPDEDFVYFGDCGRMPYGEKTKETIVEYTLQNSRFLFEKDIKVLVIACNTSSAYAFDLVKREFDAPVFEVIGHGARAGLAVTKNKRIGVIGTSATIKSGAYARAIEGIDSEAEVFSKACPLFAPLVEEGKAWWDSEVAEGIARVYLEGFKEGGIDTLVLGCTHYPLLKKAIRKALGSEITLVDPAAGTALSVSRALDECDMRTRRGKQRAVSLFTSGTRDSIGKFASLSTFILECGHEDIKVSTVDIEGY